MHMLITQTEAMQRLGVARMTLWRWEKRGVIARAQAGRPGVWYDEARVAALSRDHYLVLRQVPARAQTRSRRAKAQTPDRKAGQ